MTAKFSQLGFKHIQKSLQSQAIPTCESVPYHPGGNPYKFQLSEAIITLVASLVNVEPRMIFLNKEINIALVSGNRSFYISFIMRKQLL